MKKFTKITTLILGVFAAFAFFARPAAAGNEPNHNMPTCPHPGGQLVASYNDGDHAIVGYGTYRGTDHVYKISDGMYVQCFCPTARTGSYQGVQSDWIHEKHFTHDQEQYLLSGGWHKVDDGKAWGLPDGYYFVKNRTYECKGQDGDCITPTKVVYVDRYDYDRDYKNRHNDYDHDKKKIIYVVRDNDDNKDHDYDKHDDKHRGGYSYDHDYDKDKHDYDRDREEKKVVVVKHDEKKDHDFDKDRRDRDYNKVVVKHNDNGNKYGHDKKYVTYKDNDHNENYDRKHVVRYDDNNDKDKYRLGHYYVQPVSYERHTQTSFHQETDYNHSDHVKYALGGLHY